MMGLLKGTLRSKIVVFVFLFLCSCVTTEHDKLFNRIDIQGFTVYILEDIEQMRGIVPDNLLSNDTMGCVVFSPTHGVLSKNGQGCVVFAPALPYMSHTIYVLGKVVNGEIVVDASVLGHELQHILKYYDPKIHDPDVK